MTSKNTDMVLITVRNEQTSGDMRDVVTESGKGTFRENNGACYITYKTDSAAVLIKAQGDMVNVRRTGDAASDIKYKLGKRTYFEYKTPYGTFSMSVFTSEISINPEKGRIRLKYTLETGDDEIINSMLITIKGDK